MKSLHQSLLDDPLALADTSFDAGFALTRDQRPLIERDRLRCAAVDADHDRLEVPHVGEAGWLQQRDVVDGAVGGELEILTGRVEHRPRRVRIAVDRHARARLGKVGEPLAVAARPHRHRPRLRRHREGVGCGARKHVEASVAGVPDPYKGEVPKAWIVLKDGDSVTEEDLRAYCRQRLAPYKVPVHIEFRKQLPKTMVGKVLRRALVEETRRSS